MAPKEIHTNSTVQDHLLLNRLGLCPDCSGLPFSVSNPRKSSPYEKTTKKNNFQWCTISGAIFTKNLRTKNSSQQGN